MKHILTIFSQIFSIFFCFSKDVFPNSSPGCGLQSLAGVNGRHLVWPCPLKRNIWTIFCCPAPSIIFRFLTLEKVYCTKRYLRLTTHLNEIPSLSSLWLLYLYCARITFEIVQCCLYSYYGQFLLYTFTLCIHICDVCTNAYLWSM